MATSRYSLLERLERECLFPWQVRLAQEKFKKGDLLKAAGWAAPARNAARGNILKGGYVINWTGPLYLK